MSYNHRFGYMTRKNIQIEGHRKKLVERNNFQFIVNEEKETITQKILQTPRSINYPGKPMQSVVTTEAKLRDFVGNESLLHYEVLTTNFIQHELNFYLFKCSLRRIYA